jgi:hypothetical protein
MLRLCIPFNLIDAVGVDAGAHDIEMPRLEGGEGLIDKVIRPRRLNAVAHKRLHYPRRIQLRNLGLSLLLEPDFNALLLISRNVDGLRIRLKAFPFQHDPMLPYRQGKGFGGRRGALI